MYTLKLSENKYVKGQGSAFTIYVKLSGGGQLGHRWCHIHLPTKEGMLQAGACFPGNCRAVYMFVPVMLT